MSLPKPDRGTIMLAARAVDVREIFDRLDAEEDEEQEWFELGIQYGVQTYVTQLWEFR